MKTIKPVAYSYPLVRRERITIVGGGNLAKSILLVSALRHPGLKYRVIVRSARSAELVRVFLNDLPKIDVVIETLPVVPDLSNELVILALGKKTGKFSRRSKKEALFSVNRNLVASITPQLKSSVVLVATNPTTSITKYLVEQGIQAYGIGVANDQLRFENSDEACSRAHYFAGAHNFSELAIGTFRSENKANVLFSHDEYKAILKKQDRKTFSLTHGIDYDWRNLEAINSAFPAEFRWYALQRIHSKFHATAVSAAIVIFNLVSFFLDNQSKGKVVSMEMPLFIPEINRDVVVGWPINEDAKEPVELTFDNANTEKIEALFNKYEIAGEETEPTLYLRSPFGQRLALSGDKNLLHEFYRRRIAYLYSIARTVEPNKEIFAEIKVAQLDDSIKNRFAAMAANRPEETIPQHRGKNSAEHTDLRIIQCGNERYILFPDGATCALIDDQAKTIELFYRDKTALFHELRRIIRDEICIPTFISHNARVLHAGLVICKDVAIMIVGTQGGGKSTAALAVLGDDARAKYGSSERVAVWSGAAGLLCLGIPESNTMYAGILKQFPHFRKFVRDIPDAALWDRSRKTRLQMDDILAGTGCHPIRREVAADIIIEVNYDAAVAGASSRRIPSAEVGPLLQQNDLTDSDEVRLPWLHWVSPASTPHFFNNNSALSLPAHRVDWSSIDALKEEFLNIVARYRLQKEYD